LPGPLAKLPAVIVVPLYLATRLRDVIPKRFQVAAKFWYGWLRGTLEPEMGILPRLVHPDARVIDVGGNRGIYAYQLWRLGCRVAIFEPNPICCLVLKAWSLDKPTISVHPVALSAQPGEARLHIPIDEAGVEHDASASLEHVDFAKARDQLVPIATLDSFDYGDVALIKIDVEGHERSVLRGAAATLARAKPALLIEIEQRHNKEPLQQIFATIESAGYRGFYLKESRLRDLREFDADRDQSMTHFGSSGARYINNFLFLHQDRLGAGAYESLALPPPLR
jgi:FkbM family methyltransferase